MDQYLANFKKRKNKQFIKLKNINLKNLVSKVLLAIIFFLSSLIFIRKNNHNLLLYKENVFDKSFPFTKVKNLYEKVLGSPLPTKKESTTVFKGNLMYKSKEPYYDGTLFKVKNKSLVNNIASGIVVFIGPKDNYGNTIIIQGVDGYDIWYGNIENVSVKLYDYLEKEAIIGNTINDKLYLVVKHAADFIDYDEYQS